MMMSAANQTFITGSMTGLLHERRPYKAILRQLDSKPTGTCHWSPAHQILGSSCPEFGMTFLFPALRVYRVIGVTGRGTRSTTCGHRGRLLPVAAGGCSLTCFGCFSNGLNGALPCMQVFGDSLLHLVGASGSSKWWFASSLLLGPVPFNFKKGCKCHVCSNTASFRTCVFLSK